MQTLTKENKMKFQVVTLPQKRTHETPLMLRADAYTIGADEFQSAKAKKKSIYYTVFRKDLHKINPAVYSKDDNRIIFGGLQRILERLFYKPCTHQDIDNAVLYLSTFKVTTVGLKPYPFPERQWRRVVDEFNGRPPIRIIAMPEGSVVYPGEPIMEVESLDENDKEMGELAAWFESKLLQVWSTSERITQNEHWLLKMKEMVLKVYGSEIDEATLDFTARLMLHDFGDRAGMCEQESEDLGMAHLYTFAGTDTCAGGWQAFMNSGMTPGLSLSVNALAHRNVQAYSNEKDCYDTMYDKAGNGDLISQVNDCYDSKRTVVEHHVRLALRSKKEGTGKVLVSRPDSGDPLEEILFILNAAVANGLYEEKVINGKTWKFGTFLRFIEGDGMTFEVMWNIIIALMEKGFAPFGWGLFGTGGGLRNDLKRDNLSAKYALCAMGDDLEGVVKLSATIGKTTLPGPFKLLRTPEALAAKKTIVNISEPGVDARVEYFNGTNIWKPFGIGQDDDFLVVKARIKEQMLAMPKNLNTTHGAPASDKVLADRIALIKKYSPERDLSKY